MTGKVAFFATLQSPRRLLMLAIFTILASQSQAQAQNVFSERPDATGRKPGTPTLHSKQEAPGMTTDTPTLLPKIPIRVPSDGTLNTMPRENAYSTPTATGATDLRSAYNTLVAGATGPSNAYIALATGANDRRNAPTDKDSSVSYWRNYKQGDSENGGVGFFGEGWNRRSSTTKQSLGSDVSSAVFGEGWGLSQKYEDKGAAYEAFINQYPQHTAPKAEEALGGRSAALKDSIEEQKDQDKFVDYKKTIPNKAPFPGIPNKAGEEKIVYPEDMVPFLLNESPMQLPQEECISRDGEVGECQSAFECGFTNGVVNGLCHQGMDTSAHARVCCIYPSFCGYETNREVTYFKNPDYPATTNNSGDCHFRVRLLEGVCQLRVDFVEFSLKPMDNGECNKDNQMMISSPSRQTTVPVRSLCGQLHEEGEDPTRTDLNHLYLHADEIPLDSLYVSPPNAPTEHHFDFRLKVDDYPSRWNIRLTQIKCDGAPLQAPSGCSQYYNTGSGNITSLNVVDNSYLKNTKISACILTDTSACAIRYNIREMKFGDVKGRARGGNKIGYGLTCQDYISFNGLKSCLCGTAMQKEVIIPLEGPQGFHVVTDDVYVPGAEVGYRIEYNYLHHCDKATKFFKFPKAK